jgi:hypothetical protein
MLFFVFDRALARFSVAWMSISRKARDTAHGAWRWESGGISLP